MVRHEITITYLGGVKRTLGWPTTYEPFKILKAVEALADADEVVSVEVHIDRKLVLKSLESKSGA